MDTDNIEIVGISGTPIKQRNCDTIEQRLLLSY